MTEHAQPRIAGIDIPKTLAGTLAAVSAAVVGSFLGVAGTLAGAALVSLISSIGTEVYHRYLDRGTRRLQAAFVTAPAAVGTPEVPAAEHAASETEPPRRIRWKRIALVAGTLFVLAMGTLTAAELLAGRSAADATGGRDNGAPTVFHWSGKDDDQKQQQPTDPDPSRAPAATPTGDDRTGDDRTGATTAPAGTGTGQPATTDPAPRQTTQAPAEPATTGGAETGETGETGTGTGADTEQGTAEEPQQ